MDEKRKGRSRKKLPGSRKPSLVVRVCELLEARTEKFVICRARVKEASPAAEQKGCWLFSPMSMSQDPSRAGGDDGEKPVVKEQVSSTGNKWEDFKLAAKVRLRLLVQLQLYF